MDSTVHRGLGVDLVADFEIHSVPATHYHYDATEDGTWNTVVSIGTTQRIEVHRVFLTANANITGTAKFRIGATEVGGIKNPKDGQEYMVIGGGSYSALGDYDEDLEILAPAGDYSVIVIYEVL